MFAFGENYITCLFTSSAASSETGAGKEGLGEL